MKKIICFLICIFAIPVKATILDFSEFSAPQQVSNTSFTTQGYTITTTGINFIANTAICVPACPDNGGFYLLADGGSFSISRTDGGAFSLLGFDLAEAHSIANYHADLVTVSSGSVTNGYYLDGINDGDGALNDFQNIDVGNLFDNVTSLTFSGIKGANFTNYFSVDNLNLVASSVTEPGILALLATGLISMGWSRKKKRR